MDYKNVIQELKKMGDANSQKLRHGNGLDKKHFGVNLTKLKAYAKSIHRNHELAAQLWKSDIHDAQILATYIEDPRQVKEEQVNQWINDIDSVELGDKFCANVLLKTPFAYKKMKEWIWFSDAYTKRCGFIMMALLSKKDEWLSDLEYVDFMNIIRNNIHQTDNLVKEAMNTALISIGSRSKELNKTALDYANQIGELHLENGFSNIKIPNAAKKLSDKKLQIKLNQQFV